MQFLAPTPLLRVTALAQKFKGTVAVPFIGKGAAALLPLKTGSVLVTRMDEVSVRQGLVHPGEVAKLIRRGVSVHCCSNLHAKVYVFGRRAVIGSANVSRSSMGLVEAGIETTDPAVVRDARAFVLDLCVDSVGEEFARSLMPLYPGDRLGGPGRSTRGKAQAHHSRMWVCSVIDGEWSAEAKAAHRQGRQAAEAAKQDKAKSKLVAIEFAASGWRKLKLGDRFVQHYSKGRGFDFAPPSRIIHIEPHGRDAMLYLEAPKRAGTVSSTAVRQALAAAASALTFRGEELRLVRKGATASAFTRCWAALQSA